MYYDDKKSEFKKNSLTEVNLLDSVKDFQIYVEDVAIPSKLKLKLNAHKKNITSLKFNSFGTSFITTGVDNFVKIWDAVKSKNFK
jgi:WD40 repeat protein